MINNDVIIGDTTAESVSINMTELSARIGKGVDVNSEIIKKYINVFNKNVTYRYAYVRIPYKLTDNISYFEGVEVESDSLSHVLSESKEVILLAVTTGISIDKMMSKLSIQAPADTYYFDAIASAAIESYIEYVSDEICRGMNVTKRFSPGYADFPLAFQKYLLDRLKAKEKIGIMLSDNYLMIPMKSITAVIGIK